MKMIGLLSRKGGVGKTTLAVDLAVLAQQAGQSCNRPAQARAGRMILWRAFCQWRARRLLNAVEHWPEGGMIMQLFFQWRAERLMNAADRGLLRSQRRAGRS